MGLIGRIRAARLDKLYRDRSAVTALEYGLIAAIVATVIAVGFSNYANNLKRLASMW